MGVNDVDVIVFGKLRLEVHKERSKADWVVDMVSEYSHATRRNRPALAKVVSKRTFTRNWLVSQLGYYSTY